MRAEGVGGGGCDGAWGGLACVGVTGAEGGAGSLPGAGILKSTNGGTTWTQLASTIPTATDSTTDPWGYVNRIAISPTNNQVLLAGTVLSTIAFLKEGVPHIVWSLHLVGLLLYTVLHPDIRQGRAERRDGHDAGGDKTNVVHIDPNRRTADSGPTGWGG